MRMRMTLNLCVCHAGVNAGDEGRTLCAGQADYHQDTSHLSSSLLPFSHCYSHLDPVILIFSACPVP